MNLEFEVELPDTPGQLSELLQMVATHGGNVVSILHRHERAAGGRVPVAVTVDIADKGALRLLDALARHHRLLRVSREGGPAQVSLLLVGHVFEADLRALLDTLFEHGADVGELDARLAGRSNPSAVLARVSADDERALRRAVDALRERAQKVSVSVFEELGGEPVE